jgi:predicted dinucleotide-binding enzyme
MQNEMKLKVAVIGLGNIGKAVASNLIEGKRGVIVADKTFAKATDLAQQLGSLATPMEVGDAVKAADILVLAIYFASIKEFLAQYATELKGKTIIDPSNPIAPDEKGGFMKIIAENESAGHILSTLLPEGVRLAKALGSLGAGSLATVAHKNTASVLFYATDDQSLNSDVEGLIRDNGFEPLRIGGLDQSIRMEVFGDLHEFGALGKPVGIDEAKSKL